jgi:hypothetical protein
MGWSAFLATVNLNHPVTLSRAEYDLTTVSRGGVYRVDAKLKNVPIWRYLQFSPGYLHTQISDYKIKQQK